LTLNCVGARCYANRALLTSGRVRSEGLKGTPDGPSDPSAMARVVWVSSAQPLSPGDCGPACLASISTAGVPTNTNPRRENVACVCFSASLEDRESQQCAAKLRISCGEGDLQISSCDASFDHQVGNSLARKTANSGRPIPRSSTEIACLAGANSGCRA